MSIVTGEVREVTNVTATPTTFFCEHCDGPIPSDVLAFSLPEDDYPDGYEGQEHLMRLHALCANDYVMRVLAEVDVDPDEIMAVLG